jgi:hypothetical protein
MQDNKGYFGKDFDVLFTDGDKRIIRNENGWFAHIDLLLLEAGVIQEIPYENTAYQVERNLEVDGLR